MDFDINTMTDHMKQSTKNLDDETFISTTSKFIHTKPCHFPYSTQNPYDDGLLFDSFQLKKDLVYYSNKSSDRNNPNEINVLETDILPIQPLCRCLTRRRQKKLYRRIIDDDRLISASCHKSNRLVTDSEIKKREQMLLMD
jgi:hypothetical protein